MRYYFQTVSVLAASAMLSTAHADNLLQVYSQAAKSDPVFSQAIANWQATKMNLPIARAGYLPQVTVGANGGPGFTNTGSLFFGGGTPISNFQYGYTLSLSQPIFNFVVWNQIKGANAQVKAATATYLAAQQSLMQRTVQAYLNVLQAYDQLRYTIANKKAVKEQLVTAREQFRVGLIAITNQYDAQANYDQVVAQQITAQNNLNTQLEALRQLTGHYYGSLSGLNKQLPLIRPKPNDVDKWVSVAETQNYSLQAQNYTVQAAMDTIKQKAASGYPSLALNASYAGGNNTLSLNNTNAGSLGSNATFTSGNIGLGLSYQPIQGGLVDASVRQARYQYAAASGLLEQTHRSVVYQTRSSFLSVLSNTSQIKADRQTITSSRNALAATEAGLKVGTRTMVDVLSAMTALYQSEQQYANDQYAYMNNFISLKAAAGTLSVADLELVNSWLTKSVRFPMQATAGLMPNDYTDSKIKMDGVVQPIKSSLSEQAVQPVNTAARMDRQVIKNVENTDFVNKNPVKIYSLDNDVHATKPQPTLPPPQGVTLPAPG